MELATISFRKLLNVGYKKIKTMTKTITIDVPDEVEEIIKKNPKLKNMFKKDLIKRIAYSEMEKGSISLHLLDLVVGGVDTTVKAMEDELEILKTLRNRARKRVDYGN